MKNNFRIVLIAAVVGLLSACGPTDKSKHEQKATVEKTAMPAPEASPADTAKQRSCQLTMGFDVWEPYQFVGIGHKVQGMDVELIKMIANRIDCDVEFKQDSWGNLLAMLKEGKIDLVSGASVTEERKQFALFSDPYRSEEFQLYVRADEAYRYRQATVADFVRDNNKIGIIGEYFYGDELTKLMDDEKYGKLFKSTFMGEINVARLIDGDINGFLEDSFVGASLLRRKGLEKYITPHQASIHTGDVYVMFSKASVKPALVEKFNEALSAIKKNGQYDRLIAKYSE